MFAKPDFVPNLNTYQLFLLGLCRSVNLKLKRFSYNLRNVMRRCRSEKGIKKSFDTAAGVFTIHTTHYKFLFLLLLWFPAEIQPIWRIAKSDIASRICSTRTFSCHWESIYCKETVSEVKSKVLLWTGDEFLPQSFKAFSLAFWLVLVRPVKCPWWYIKMLSQLC